jgi:hypothetical protein
MVRSNTRILISHVVLCGSLGTPDAGLFEAGFEFRSAPPSDFQNGSATLPLGAGVAQLAEQLFCKQQVTGSIPVAGSMEEMT